jgi:Putative transposase
MIVPGGGISPDGQRWVSSRPAFLLPVRVLGKLFRRLFLTRLAELFDAGRLRFFGTQAGLAERPAFLRHLAPTRKKPWIVYAKPPFAGPAAVLAYLSRYTHRVAISNRRLLALDERGVTFRYKDYRREGVKRYQAMTLAADEFIRRFLLHVLPRGFHRIRHYGLLASGGRRHNLARARELLAAPPRPPEPDVAPEPSDHRPPCPCCGGRMLIPRLSSAASSHAHHRGPRAHPDGVRRDPARPAQPQDRSPAAVNGDPRPSPAKTAWTRALRRRSRTEA